MNFPFKIELLAKDELHISLSRTFPIRFHHIKPLLHKVKEKADCCFGFAACLSCFLCRFDAVLQNFIFLPNDDCTRSFLALCVPRGPSYDIICRMISLMDGLLSDFKFPIYYSPAIPHLSIASCLGDVTSIAAIKNEILATEKIVKINVGQICVKIGQKIDKFALQSIG